MTEWHGKEEFPAHLVGEGGEGVKVHTIVNSTTRYATKKIHFLNIKTGLFNQNNSGQLNESMKIYRAY